MLLLLTKTNFEAYRECLGIEPRGYDSLKPFFEKIDYNMRGRYI